MKIILAIVIFLFAGIAQAFEIIGVDSVNVKATYTEPITNKTGSTLIDLDHITVYYDLGAGMVIGIEEPASSPTGGVFQTVIFPVSVAEDQELDVPFVATATDKTGNESVESNTSTLRIDRLAPAAPQ